MKKYKLKVDDYELKIIINALNVLRTRQIEEERPTDPVDELLIKTVDLLTKKK